MTKEFKEKFVANIENRNDRIECKNLMQYVPQSLYQYKRGIAKNEKSEFYEINQLKNNKIWMSKVSKLNDPYDSAFLVDLKSEANLDNEELPDNVQQILEEYQKKLDIKSNDFKESIYISCFSESSQLLLMWSHYANSHKGFCIEYDYSKLQFMELSACPVLYNNNYNFSNLDKTNIVHKILTKSEEWEYEKEWRIFKIEKNEDPLVDGPIPKAIYMGCKIDESPELKNELLCYCKEFNVKLIQKVMKKNSFCLEDRELTLA